MSVKMQLTQDSKANLNKQMSKLNKLAPNVAFKGLVTMLFDIKTLAQQKLKFDKHIVSSRLRNSIFVKTMGQKFAQLSDNSIQYNDKDGKSYSRDFTLSVDEFEGAVGTNVEYADKIEFQYDSFLYWAMKNVDTEKRGREMAKELLNGIK